MKLKSLLAIAAVAVFSAFKPATKPENFTVDTKKSTIEWVGKKVTGQHSGTLRVQSGTLGVEGNSLRSGVFKIDMNSLACTDLEGESAKKLEGHLKNDDFFGTSKFPVADFVITKVSPAAAGTVNITGNLTIKGITNPVSFLATVKRTGNTVVAVAKNISVDRTKYGVKYGSKSFFDSIGDKAIDDNFTLSVNLIASK